MSRLRFVSSQHFKVGISLALAFIMLSVCLSAILLWEICLLFFLGCFKIFSYFLVVCIFMSLWLELCFFLFIQLDKCYPFCICEFISFTNSGNLGHFLFKRFLSVLFILSSWHWAHYIDLLCLPCIFTSLHISPLSAALCQLSQNTENYLWISSLGVWNSWEPIWLTIVCPHCGGLCWDSLFQQEFDLLLLGPRESLFRVSGSCPTC